MGCILGVLGFLEGLWDSVTGVIAVLKKKTCSFN